MHQQRKDQRSRQRGFCSFGCPEITLLEKVPRKLRRHHRNEGGLQSVDTLFEFFLQTLLEQKLSRRCIPAPGRFRAKKSPRDAGFAWRLKLLTWRQLVWLQLFFAAAASAFAFFSAAAFSFLAAFAAALSSLLIAAGLEAAAAGAAAAGFDAAAMGAPAWEAANAPVVKRPAIRTARILFIWIYLSEWFGFTKSPRKIRRPHRNGDGGISVDEKLIFFGP